MQAVLTITPMSPLAIPSAAATLVLLRDRPVGPAEILLIQRHGKSKFAAGDYVFAGGKVEADDIPDDVERFCRGLTAADASARLGGDLTPRQALGYWVGAIREAFEEVGVLLAYDRGGEFVRLTAENHDRFEAHRKACQSANPAFFTMLRAEELTLATDRLTYFAHWITPEEQPLRFDTRFFAAEMPRAQEPEVDGHEIVALRWLTAAEAFAALRRKEITLRLPTIKNLELLQGAGARTTDVLGGLRGRAVPTIRPRVLQVDGKPIAVLPGDPRWY
jgi:8-oxo-dGTP pyrophosphatase MutT (NUDIX family)